MVSNESFFSTFLGKLNMQIQQLLIGDVLVRALVSCHSSIDDRNEKKKKLGESERKWWWHSP